MSDVALECWGVRALRLGSSGPPGLAPCDTVSSLTLRSSASAAWGGKRRLGSSGGTKGAEKWWAAAPKRTVLLSTSLGLEGPHKEAVWAKNKGRRVLQSPPEA